tara:strand:- start:12 stop:383 length:372 start_codon:yes stop_codon:yes gene_type:complete
MASLSGKIELETFEEGREGRVMEDLVKRAVAVTFSQYFGDMNLDDIVESFDIGNTAQTGSDEPGQNYQQMLANINGLPAAVLTITDDNRPEVQASAIEFILEGLHLNRRLNCERTPVGNVYRR